MYVRFKNPFIFEGEEHEGVELDLDRLTGNDLEKAQEIIVIQKKVTPNVPEFSKAYLSEVAALAARKPVEFFKALPVREYIKVTVEVQNFLLDGVSDQESTQ
jgi:hypothetical protein